MAVALDSHYETNAGSGSTSVSFSYEMNLGGTPDTKMALVVGIWYSYGSISSVTYNGTSLGAAKTSSEQMSWFCKEFGSTDGSYTYSYTQSNGANVIHLLSSWTGVDQTTPSQGWTNATNYGTAAATSSITCPTDGAVVGGCYNAGGNYTSVGSGNTLIAYYASYTNTVHTRRTTTGAIAATASSASTWYAAGGALNAAAAAAASAAPRRAFPRFLQHF